MRLPKIYIIGSSKTKKYFYGGVASLISDECDELKKRSINFKLLNLEMLYESRDLISRFKFLFYLSKIIFKEKPKIAWIHGPFYLFITFIPLKLVGSKIILQMHGIPQPEIEPNLKLKFIAYFHIFVYYLLARYCDYVITISKANKNRASDLFGKAKYIVIYNGIKIKKIRFFKRKNKRVKILFLGRIHPYKGIREVVELAKRVDAEFIIAGEGPIFNEIKEKTRYIKNVKLLGRVSEKKKNYLLKEADIFLLPSYYEWFGISFLEAMQYYLPIVSTRSGAIPEIIQDKKNGLLVSLGDISALEKALKTLIENKRLRERMGKEGRLILEKKFDIKITVDRLIDLFNKVYNK
jgi:glycosyltransferase involved in cell wall biosynthesis